MKSTMTLESQVETILIDRFSQKMDPDMKGLLGDDISPDNPRKPFETAALFLTMDLISQSKRTVNTVKKSELLEHIRYAIDRLEEMNKKQEISEAIFLSCQQELYKLIYDKGF